MEPHARPSFADILIKLESVADSQFVETNQESFRTMQEVWHREIEAKLEELRAKDEVS